MCPWSLITCCCPSSARPGPLCFPGTLRYRVTSLPGAERASEPSQSHSWRDGWVLLPYRFSFFFEAFLKSSLESPRLTTIYSWLRFILSISVTAVKYDEMAPGKSELPCDASSGRSCRPDRLRVPPAVRIRPLKPPRGGWFSWYHLSCLQYAESSDGGLSTC